MSEYLAERKTSALAQFDENRELAAMAARIQLARQFPRDTELALNNILHACKSKDVAESAIYSYPKGGQEVKGASIRLAEVVAQHWGNFMSGLKELNRTETGADVSVFAWDLQSNYQDEKQFHLDFVRNTKKGSYAITDERERYELMANYGARRKRACILAVIPQYVFDLAMEQCEKTLTGDINDQNIEEVRLQILSAFQAFGDWITEEALGGLFGKSFDALNARDIAKLRHLYASIKDGFVSAEVAFGRVDDTVSTPSMEEQDKVNDFAAKIRGAVEDA